MIEIKRNWNKLPIGERVAFIGNVIAKQEATPKVLPHDDPNLAALKAKYLTAKEKHDAVVAAEEELKMLKTARMEAVDAAAQALGPNASFVEGVAENEAQVVGVGYQPVAAPVPVGTLPAPGNLSVSAGDSDGELDWSVDAVNGAVGYQPRTTTDPNNASLWKEHPISTRSSGTITGLPSGVRHYVQICAIGSKGMGPWSDIAWRMVP